MNTSSINSKDSLYNTLPSEVFQYSGEGVMLTDIKRRIVDVNPAFETITGYAKKEVFGKKPSLLSSGIHSKEFYQSMSEALHTNGNWCGDIWNRRKCGTIYLENLSITTVQDPQDKQKYYLGILRDITEQRLYRDKLRQESLFDPLTNLANRKLLSEKLYTSMMHADVNGTKLCIYFLDLDGFKQVNDNFGHDVGDLALIEISKKLKACLRENDMIARIGGDEFAGVIQNVDNDCDCLPILNRILLAAAEPFSIKGNDIKMSTSLGVTYYPQSTALEGEQLLRQADFAMYQAKQNGKNKLHVFDLDDEQHHRDQNIIQEELARGVEQDELVLHYQPKVNMATGQLMGVEALVRWQHPKRGLLAPNEFLPHIEEHNLSVDLGYWVIERALKQIVEWRSTDSPISVSVNITSRHLHQDDFVANLQQLLTYYNQIDTGSLELEIVESSVLHDVEKVARVIQKCRELGVDVSMDDFGSGYSSLRYLRRLPVSKLKIDKSFIQNILYDTSDLTIIEAVMALASAFNCEVIAEGVENEAQGILLLKLGCNQAQGFYIAKPMTAQQLTCWCKNKPEFPEWACQQKLTGEELLLQYAIVEHRSWLNTAVSYVLGRNMTLPSLNHNECLFSSWYERSKNAFGQRAVHDEVFARHKLLHEKVKELVSIRDVTAHSTLQLKIDELKQLSSHFLSMLNNETIPHENHAD